MKSTEITGYVDYFSAASSNTHPTVGTAAFGQAF
jgi:hypothetical protein